MADFGPRNEEHFPLLLITDPQGNPLMQQGCSHDECQPVPCRSYGTMDNARSTGEVDKLHFGGDILGIEPRSSLSIFREYYRSLTAHGTSTGSSEELSSHRSILHRRLDTRDQVKEWLNEIGLEMYAENFSKYEVAGETLYNLTSRDLREDVGVRNLSHRRKILKEIASLITVLKPETSRTFLPEFGRILDHLSNVRTFHSWLRVAVQQFIFAFALLRLAPEFRSVKLATCSSLYCFITGTLCLSYGGWRYMHVTSMIELAVMRRERWWQDDRGIFAASGLVLVAAVVILVVIILDDA